MMYELVEQFALQHLRLVRPRNDYIGAACPFHKGGMETRPSFWIRREDGGWGCFTCGHGGRNLKSLARELGVKVPGLDEALKEAEHELESNKVVENARKEKRARTSFEGESKLPENLLGVYDWCPLELVEKGFTKKTLKDHDVGFDKKRNRITFPIRDLPGNLIGISGRSTDGSEPKYKIYTGRIESNGKVIDMGELGEMFPSYSSDGIKNHLWRANKIFYPLFRNEVPQDQQYLIIVEGFKACMWVVQCGWPNTVALMGNKMTPQQEKIVRMLGVPTWILLDNNEPGHEGAYKVSGRLGDGTFPVFRCYYPEECDETTQPDNLTTEQIYGVIQSAKRIGGRYGFKQREQH